MAFIIWHLLTKMEYTKRRVERPATESGLAVAEAIAAAAGGL